MSEFIRCTECGKYVLSFSKETVCAECKSAKDMNTPWKSTNRVRCPKCHDWEELTCDDEATLKSGSHYIYCGLCGHMYKVSTIISITIESPEGINIDDSSPEIIKKKE